ncbi:MAG: nuclear transport factor 2 family protein [Gemmatimonadetes bacterium]|nr:nuclear transport factor 2 family protein [Gemmatimonadota bacterium]
MDDFIRTMFQAIDGRDWDALANQLHPEVRYDRPGFEPLMGRDAVIHFYREVRQIHGRHHLDHLIANDREGAHFGHFVGAKPDGTPFTADYADYYGFKDGLLWRRKSYFHTSLGV